MCGSKYLKKQKKMLRAVLRTVLAKIPGLWLERFTSHVSRPEETPMKIWIIEPDETCVTTLLKDQLNRMGEENAVPPSLDSDARLREERRLFPRIPCFLLVDYAMQGCAYRAFIRNISAEGAFIESHGLVPHGSDISLVISILDHQHPVKITGEIVRIREEGLAVRFDPAADLLLAKLPL